MTLEEKFELEYLREQKIKQEVIDFAKELLANVGYEFIEKDTFYLKVSLNKVDNYILNITNQESVPEGLKFVRVFRIVGDILYTKLMNYGIDTEKFQLEPFVTELQRGDTRTTFEKPQMTSREIFLKYLKEVYLNYGESEIEKYKRLSWYGRN